MFDRENESLSDNGSLYDTYVSPYGKALSQLAFPNVN